MACPFCGGKPSIIKNMAKIFEAYKIVCGGCQTQSGDFFRKEDAVEKWNKRK